MLHVAGRESKLLPLLLNRQSTRKSFSVRERPVSRKETVRPSVSRPIGERAPRQLARVGHRALHHPGNFPRPDLGRLGNPGQLAHQRLGQKFDARQLLSFRSSCKSCPIRLCSRSVVARISRSSSNRREMSRTNQQREWWNQLAVFPQLRWRPRAHASTCHSVALTLAR